MGIPPEQHIVPFQVAEPPPGPYLVFAPHPDDEAIGMGGTILLARRKGIEVTVVVVTDGSAGGDPAVRRREAQEAAEVLGLSGLEFVGLPDRGVTDEHMDPSWMESLVQRYGPANVFSPSPMDIHPDHRAVAVELIRAMRAMGWGGEVWFYETLRQVEINRLVDISPVVEEKLKAINIYRSQTAQVDYGEVARGLNGLRGVTLGLGRFAEGFLAGPATLIPALLEERCSIYLGPLAKPKGAGSSMAVPGEAPGPEPEGAAQETPLVSIIVRTKDRPHLLRRALESLARQTYPRVEAVVINDGGQDVTPVVERFEGRFEALVHRVISPGMGRTRAANVGISLARGQWVGFLDDDDLLLPRAIERLSAHFASGLPVYGATIVYDPEARRRVERLFRPFDPRRLFFTNYIPFISILVPAEMAKEYPLDEEFQLFEDWDWIYRLALGTEFVAVNRPVAVYWASEGATIRRETELHRAARRMFYRKHLSTLTPDAIAALEGERMALALEVEELRLRLKEELARSGALECEVAEVRRVLDERNGRIGELEWEVKEVRRVLDERDARIGELECEVKGLKDALDECRRWNVKWRLAELKNRILSR